MTTNNIDAPMTGTLQLLAMQQHHVYVWRWVAYWGQPPRFDIGYEGEIEWGIRDYRSGFGPCDLPSVGVGLWLLEWPWTADQNGDAVYGESRWRRPTMTDLIALGLLPADSVLPAA